MTTRIALTIQRLLCQDNTHTPLVIYRGAYVDEATVPARALSLGFLGPGHAWWDVPLPDCPDCDGTLEWRENGFVPGARACVACHSLFVVETREIPDRRGDMPTTVLDSRISLLLDDSHNTHLPASLREQIRLLWLERNTCPDFCVARLSQQLISLVWPWALQPEEPAHA